MRRYALPTRAPPAFTGHRVNAVSMRVYSILIFRVLCRLAHNAALEVSRLACVTIWRHWPRRVRVFLYRGSERHIEGSNLAVVQFLGGVWCVYLRG